MLKIVSRFSLLPVIVALSLVIFVSCAGPQTATGPAAGMSTPAALKVLGISTLSEIKPSSSDNLTCVTTDDHAQDITYTWTAADGTFQGSGKQVVWIAPETPGDYNISVKISRNGEEDTFSRSIKVTTNPYNNEQPDTTIYLKFKLPSSDIVSAGEQIRMWSTQDIQCVVDGSNPADLTYTWTSPTGKLVGDGIAEGKASRVGWIAPEAGLYKVSVVVTDKGGDSAQGEVDFDVYCCHPK